MNNDQNINLVPEGHLNEWNLDAAIEQYLLAVQMNQENMRHTEQFPFDYHQGRPQDAAAVSTNTPTFGSTTEATVPHTRNENLASMQMVLDDLPSTSAPVQRGNIAIGSLNLTELAILEEEFKKAQNPTVKDLLELAQRLNRNTQTIELWFSNRRREARHRTFLAQQQQRAVGSFNVDQPTHADVVARSRQPTSTRTSESRYYSRSMDSLTLEQQRAVASWHVDQPTHASATSVVATSRQRTSTRASEFRPYSRSMDSLTPEERRNHRYWVRGVPSWVNSMWSPLLRNPCNAEILAEYNYSYK